jgi:nucleoside-diphosphate-sugar epimerase
MIVVVTGGDGLLGRELCDQLRSRDQVFALVHSMPINPLDGVTYSQVDLSRPLVLNNLPSRVDVVYHLAQSSRFREFPEGTRDTFDVNTRSTLDLLEYCRTAGGGKFFLASTGGVYSGQSQAISEAGSLIPPSEIGFYFASKLASEMFSSTYRTSFSVTVLRIFFMYGIRQRRDMFLPRLVNNVLTGQPITVTANGGTRVNPVAVSDVAQFIAQENRTSYPEVINIGGPDVVSIEEIAHSIGNLVGRQPVFQLADYSSDVVADIAIMRGLLGDQTLTPFEVGLASLVDAIRSNYS